MDLNKINTFILKNKKEIICTHIKLSDFQIRHEFYVALIEKQEGVLPLFSEIDIHTEESQEHIKDFLYNKNGLWLVAKFENKIIGEIDLTISKLYKLKQNAKLTLGVHPNWQSLGVGSILMKEALNWASKRNLKRIYLDVFSINQKAIDLYKKFGFEIEGIRKNHVHVSHNNYIDEVLMAKFI